MKSKFDSKEVPRTSGWHSQPEYDTVLGDLDVSSLKFLNHKYAQHIQDFHNHFDLGDVDNQKEYQEMLQRKKMIQEEITHRMQDIYASPSYQDRSNYFDPETGLVLDEDNNILYSISFNEYEDDYVYHHTDTEHKVNGSTEMLDDYDEVEVVSMREGTKLIGYKVIERERSLKDVYSGWNYYMNEEEENYH